MSMEQSTMAEPQYRLEGIVRTRSDVMEDFEGDVTSKCLLGFFHSKAAHVQKKNSPKLE